MESFLGGCEPSPACMGASMTVRAPSSHRLSKPERKHEDANTGTLHAMMGRQAAVGATSSEARPSYHATLSGGI